MPGTVAIFLLTVTSLISAVPSALVSTLLPSVVVTFFLSTGTTLTVGLATAACTPETELTATTAAIANTATSFNNFFIIIKFLLSSIELYLLIRNIDQSQVDCPIANFLQS